MTERQWLTWVRRVQAIAQNGLHYTEGPFDRERYEELQRIAAGMLAAVGGGLDPDRVRTALRLEDGYATPKVDVRGVVFRDDRILLVREREDGAWSLPGGWVDAGASPSEAVAKEVLEESGFRTRAVKVLAVYDRDRHGVPDLPWQVYKIFLRCELLGGAAAGSIETDEVGFFAEGEIPPLSTGRVTPAQIRRMFEHRRSPHLPTDFD
jgi:ADP-ribose pyrophosphatase YjhB (NUDIX family)